MRVLNKPRGYGKTGRMLYLSEYTGKNIVVATREQAAHAERFAQQIGLKIPKVLTVADFLDRGVYCSNEIIVDEALDVLKAFVTAVRPAVRISDATLTCYEGVRDN